jgi:endoglucanase
VISPVIVLPSWSQVRLLGYYTLVRLEKHLPEVSKPDVEKIKMKLVSFADDLTREFKSSFLASVMGGAKKDFIWGSNSVAANQAIVLIQAYRISNDQKYIDYALSNLDYILGRNGTGYSFVTGFGDKTPMHPHHRPSIADGIVDPIPGLLSGGPNPGMQDKCKYASSVADEAFADDDCSYASNEIAINWNAPLVYLTGAIEVFYTR